MAACGHEHIRGREVAVGDVKGVDVAEGEAYLAREASGGGLLDYRKANVARPSWEQ